MAVAEELHVSRAAEKLHVAQPAVSEQIRKLERDLGVELLDRTRQRIALTDAGAAFLAEARRVLEGAQLARLAARSAQGREASRLRVGYAPAALPAIVPRTLQATPGVGHAASGGQRARRGAAGADRLGPRRAPGRSDRVPARPHGRASRDPARRRARRGRRASAAPSRGRWTASPSPRSLPSGSSCFRASPTAASTTRSSAGELREAGLAPTFVEMPDAHLERALLAVAAGAGMALLPESVADRYVAPGVRFVSLEGDEPVVAVAALTRRDSSHLPTAAFLRELARARESGASLHGRTDAANAA